MTAKRPRRKNSHDRLTSPLSTANQQKCDMAAAPFQRLADTMDRKWGIDRLPELVSADTAAKYGSAIAKLNAALDASDPEETLKRAQVCQRGLAAMDQEATAAGQPQSDPSVWEAEIDGWKFGIMPDGRDWQAAKAARPDLSLFTMREVAVALRSLNLGHPLIEKAKQLGGAEIVRIHEKLPDAFYEAGGDELDF